MGELLRTGRKVGRTIYVQHGLAPADDDPLVGVMDTEALASRVVDAVNGAALHTVQELNEAREQGRAEGREQKPAVPVAREDTASPDEDGRTVSCPDCGADVKVLDSIPALAPVVDDHKWLGVLCSGSGTTLSRPAPAQAAVAPDTKGAAPTRDALVAAFDEALFYTAPDGARVFKWTDERLDEVDEPLLANQAERMADVALGVLRGGDADGSGEDEEALRSLAVAVAASDEAPDMGLAWLTDYTHAETEDAWTAGTCVLGKCADRRYPDAVCEHGTDDHRREVVRLRRVVQRIGATNITHLSRQYRAICKRYGRASAEIARLRGENARLRTEEREEVTKLRSKVTAARPNFGHIARLATAAGVSPDSEDVVGAIEAAIRAGREPEVVTGAVAAQLPPGSLVVLARSDRDVPLVHAQVIEIDGNKTVPSWRESRFLVLDRAPAPTPAPLTVGELVETAADLDAAATVGTIVEDWVANVGRRIEADDGEVLGWGIAGLEGTYQADEFVYPVRVVRVGTGRGES